MPDCAAFNNQSEVLPELTFWFCLSSYLIETSSLLSKYLFTVSLLLFPFVTFSILPAAPPPQRDKDFDQIYAKFYNLFAIFSDISFSVLYLICKELWKLLDFLQLLLSGSNFLQALSSHSISLLNTNKKTEISTRTKF